MSLFDSLNIGLVRTLRAGHEIHEGDNSNVFSSIQRSAKRAAPHSPVVRPQK
jgi:hypothetical protein